MLYEIESRQSCFPAQEKELQLSTGFSDPEA